MVRMIIIVIGWLIISVGLAPAQTVTVTDFPLGVGGNLSDDFFRPYEAELRAIVDSLSKYPQAVGIITGGADGEQYREQNDAKNPALALGRAHLLRNYIIASFPVDPTRLLVQSDEVRTIGAAYRYASIRVDRGRTDLESRIDALEKMEPIERHFTQVKEITSVPAEENLGLRFSLGLSSSPFGGIPSATSAFAWKRSIYVEVVVGHTFWNSSFRYKDVDLDTKRRLVGGQVVYFPFEDKPVGVVAGWIRIEEISQDYYEYVKLSDGPTLGLRVTPYRFISITGLYNPSKHRESGSNRSDAKNGQFLLSVSAFLEIGGEK